MSNVLAFRPQIRPTRAGNLATLSQAVALHRRASADVFWLKENAEFLNILAALNTPVDDDTLAPYATFYHSVEERLQFYPQYYRFFLSMILDLEDLGMRGDKGARISSWVQSEDLIEAELSDLQRAEAHRLLARRNMALSLKDSDLGARLRRFVSRSATFAVPNKKAAYELTHIVFYLSEYGRVDPGLGPEAIRSLEYAGLVAYIDQNHDLLAEICTSLRFAGMTPSPIWTAAVAHAHRCIEPQEGRYGEPALDGYHAFMVTGWAEAVAGNASFEAEIPEGGVYFPHHMNITSALRPVSECLFDLGDQRSTNWTGMRGRVEPFLSAQHQLVLQRAEDSSSRFEEFFAAFARAARA